MGIPMEQMYRQRKDFVIVALTGITGSGCSDLADIMSKPFPEWERRVRLISEMEAMRVDDKREMVFQREYELCYHVCEKQYQPFEVIKYRNVLLLCTLELLTGECKEAEQMRHAFAEIVKQKFDKSREIKADVEDTGYVVNKDIQPDYLKELGLTDDLCNRFFKIATIEKQDKKRTYRKELYLLYEDTLFVSFCEHLYEELKQRDYYAKNFFVHRLATALRAVGSPIVTVKHDYEYENDHVFDVADKINALIKGYHEAYPDKGRRFVIDSVRNSMEILYLRERYNAFYMIALHNDGSEVELIREKVSQAAFGNSWEKISNDQQNEVLIQTRRIMNLSSIESEIEDFEDGKFYGSDISRCVTESEIHIAYHDVKEFAAMNKDELLEKRQMFYSTAEQWMKFYSLIIRPGLITPSRDERCMSVAYVAKFNSGCISRQVGCTIVDAESAIQSVGWNDPPSEQLPCQLRYADEMCKYGSEGYRYVPMLGSKLFSQFELNGVVKKKYGDGRLFAEHFKEDINEGTLAALKEQGLRYSYCFRARYNKYKGPKDQVNTRSLHAEENTMLRLARSGGQGLIGGTMYVTASPCVLCSKKAYQIGIKEIVYLDPYTDIAPDLILACGFNQPKLRPFMGAIGETFYKLYKPFLPYKDELAIWDRGVKKEKK